MSNQTHLRELHQSGATDGQVATFDNALGHWIPATPAAGGGGGASSAVRAYRSGTNFPIPDITFTEVEFNAENYDTDGIHDNAVSPSRFTCQVAGKYIIAASLTVSGAPTVWQARIMLNSVTIIAQKYNLQSTDANVLLVTEYDLAVGDELYIEMFQNSGGSIDVLNGQGNSWFAIALIGGSEGFAFSEDTMGDADKTWTVGRSTMRMTTNFTAQRELTLPAANSLVAGSVIFLNDSYRHIFGSLVVGKSLKILAAGSDEINNSADIIFAPNRSDSNIGYILIFVTDGVSKWACANIYDYSSFLNTARTYDPVVLAVNTNRQPSLTNDVQVTITFNLESDNGETATGTVLVDSGGNLVFQTIATAQNNFNVTGIAIGGTSIIKQAVSIIVPVGSNYKWVAAGSGVVSVVDIYELIL